ncbi:MAG: glycosyltransferase family 39 protein [Chloroflexi bacterium]|nr:glycosyltransferase family 39 protein [Chloroflexota bacterium]
MNPSRLLRALALLLAVLGLLAFAAALAGYDALKPLADQLAADGTLELFTPEVHAGLVWALGVSGGLLLLAAWALRRRAERLAAALAAFSWRAQFAPLAALLRPEPGERPFGLALLAVTLAGALGRALLLNQPMGHDEAYTYVAFAARGLKVVLTDYHLPNNHVLHSALVFFSTRLFGDAPWAVRLPAWLAGVALIPLIYLVGRAFYNRAVGLLAAAFTAALPVLVDFSADARGYTLMAVFALLAFLTAEAQRRAPTALGWALLALWFGLGLYTLPIMLLPMALLGGWWLAEWLAGGRRRSNLFGMAASALGGLALMLLLYSPIYVFGTGFDSVFFNRFVRPLPPDEFGPTLGLRLGQTRTLWTLGQPWLDLLLAGGFILSLLFHRRLAKSRFPVQIPGLLAMAAIMAARGLAPLPRNWAFIAPFVLLWVAAGWVGLGGWLLARLNRPAWGRALLLSAVAAAALGGLAFSAQTARVRLAQPGVEERVAAYLDEYAGPGGRILTTSPLRAPLSYYLSRRGDLEAYLYTEGDAVDWVVAVIGLQNETLESDAAKHGWAGWLDIPAAERLTTIGYAELWGVPVIVP